MWCDGLGVLGAVPWHCSTGRFWAVCHLQPHGSVDFSAGQNSQPAVPLRYRDIPWTGSSKHGWEDVGQLCAPSLQILLWTWPVCRVFPQPSKHPAPITAVQTSGMDFRALSRWHLDCGWAWQGWICSWILILEVFYSQDSAMMMIIMIVEKNNLFLKREIHYGLLGEEEANIGVVLIELSLNCFLSGCSQQQILECGCTPRLPSWALWQILIPKILPWTELCFTKQTQFMDYEVTGSFLPVFTLG